MLFTRPSTMRWSRSLRPPWIARWQRVHDPVYREWQRIVVFEHDRSGLEGVPPSKWGMLATLVHSVHRERSFAACVQWASTHIDALRDFRDEPALRGLLARQTHHNVNLAVVRHAFRQAEASPKMSTLLACAIIAGIIEERYGQGERGGYWLAVLRGTALGTSDILAMDSPFSYSGSSLHFGRCVTK